jgi:hypothetical protein
VLGAKESCTGDPARRIGDEFLYQQLAQANVETLTRHKAKKIVTPCPHCYNTLKNEYPQFGGHYQVQHRSQLLAELIAAGRLSNGTITGEPVTLHDPCYLARVNREVAATRTVIGAATDAQFREMPRHGTKTFCCGAGGPDVVRRITRAARLLYACAGGAHYRRTHACDGLSVLFEHDDRRHGRYAGRGKSKGARHRGVATQPPVSLRSELRKQLAEFVKRKRGDQTFTRIFRKRCSPCVPQPA